MNQSAGASWKTRAPNPQLRTTGCREAERASTQHQYFTLIPLWEAPYRHYDYDSFENPGWVSSAKHLAGSLSWEAQRLASRHRRHRSCCCRGLVSWPNKQQCTCANGGKRKAPWQDTIKWGVIHIKCNNAYIYIYIYIYYIYICIK